MTSGETLVLIIYAATMTGVTLILSVAYQRQEREIRRLRRVIRRRLRQDLERQAADVWAIQTHPLAPIHRQ